MMAYPKQTLLLLGTAICFCLSCIQQQNSLSEHSTSVSQTPSAKNSIVSLDSLIGKKYRIEQFISTISPSYEIIDSVEGDLNLDPHQDLVLVLHVPGDDTIHVNSPKRPLLILLGTTDGEFNFFAKNENLVFPRSESVSACCPDGFSGVGIQKGQFSIEHYGGMSSFRWELSISFKYDEKVNNWFLFQAQETSYDHLDHEKTRTKTEQQFGKIAFDTFDLHQFEWFE